MSRTGEVSRRAGSVALAAVVVGGLAAAGVGPASAAVAGPRAAGSSFAVPGLLAGVASASAGDAWAVGTAVVSGTVRTLTVHWNGTSWKREPSPSPADSLLTGVAVVSARDAWAVGASDVDRRTLILHWNGARWKRVPSPATARSGLLYGVTAVSARNAWAVGWTSSDHPLMLHWNWNGKTWQRGRGSATSLDGGLASVAAASRTSVWAVGVTVTQTKATRGTLVAHWNGRTWQQVPSPFAVTGGTLFGVTARSARRTWAVGCQSCSQSPPKTLVLRWDGHAWR
jgi:hypothetical protein